MIFLFLFWGYFLLLVFLVIISSDNFVVDSGGLFVFLDLKKKKKKKKSEKFRGKGKEKEKEKKPL